MAAVKCPRCREPLIQWGDSQNWECPRCTWTGTRDEAMSQANQNYMETCGFCGGSVEHWCHEGDVAIIRAIDQLGDTPNRIAERLNELGIKGQQNSSADNPLVRYLHSKGYDTVEIVTLYSIHEQMYVKVVSKTGRTIGYGSPTLAEFLTVFDSYRYPELISES